MQFDSLKSAAEYLEVENRTIKRHLDTKNSLQKSIFI